jgi:hypothetical protein
MFSFASGFACGENTRHASAVTWQYLHHTMGRKPTSHLWDAKAEAKAKLVAAWQAGLGPHLLCVFSSSHLLALDRSDWRPLLS